MKQKIVVARDLTAAAEPRPWAERAHLSVLFDRAQDEREVVAQAVVAVLGVVLRRRRWKRAQQPRNLQPHAAVQILVLHAVVERDQQRHAEQRWLRLVVGQEVSVLPGELPMDGDEVIALPVVVDAAFVLARRGNRNVVVVVLDVVAVRAAVQLRLVDRRGAGRQVVGGLRQKVRRRNRFHVVRAGRGVHERTHRTRA